MFQRFKGIAGNIDQFIDSKLSEEQTKQRSASPSKASNQASRSSTPRSGQDGPSSRAGVVRSRSARDPDKLPRSKGPDPSEFVIEDDEDGNDPPVPPSSVPSSVPSAHPTPEGGHDQGNPGATDVKTQEVDKDAVTTKKTELAASTTSDGVLPADVQQRLRKLQKLESRYHELLRSYRIAHARVSAIEPFEASLRENTPLASINDPSALVEYLSQLNLKGDMVMDELKRVSGETGTLKTRLEAAEQASKNARAEAEALRKQRDELLARAEPPSEKHETGTADDFFSYESEIPRLQDELQRKNDIIKGLENANKDVRDELEKARSSLGEALDENKVLKASGVTRDAGDTHGLRQRCEVLESQSKEIESSIAPLLPDGPPELSGRIKELCALLQSAQTARDAAQGHLQDLSSALEGTGYAASLDSKLDDVGIKSMVGYVRTLHEERQAARIACDKADEDRAELQKRLNDAAGHLAKAEPESLAQGATVDLEKRVAELSRELESAFLIISETGQFESEKQDEQPALATRTADTTAAGAEIQSGANVSGGKKKGKGKKKKAGVSAPKIPAIGETRMPPPETNLTTESRTASPSGKVPVLTDAHRAAIKATLARVLSSDRDASELRAKIEAGEKTIAALEAEISKKEKQIESLTSHLKSEDALHEEIESLRDSLTHIGQDHVVVKDKCKALEAERDELKRSRATDVDGIESAAVHALKAEKEALEQTIQARVEEIAALRASASDEKTQNLDSHGELAKQLDNLRSEAVTLQRDLSAARELAQSRFKDMTALRDHLNKLQPELNILKKSNEDLKGNEQKFQQLEHSSEALKSEVDSLKSRIVDKDAEIKRISERLRTETSKRATLQENLDKSQRAQKAAESQHIESSEAKTRLTDELVSARDEIKSLKGRLERLEQRSATLSAEAQSVKDELELKTAQQASAQSLMDSMQDQTRELATQMKELRERCDNLEEERADAHRLLQERSREGETMRRLLSDVETRAEARIKEMKERLNLAVEERDRAEDDASTAARRKGKVIDDLRAQLAESERLAANAESRRQDLEVREQAADAHKRELEIRAQRAQDELGEARAGMDRLREALEASEKLCRDAERDGAELKRAAEERERRLEKLQKGSKSMAEELRTLQERLTPARRPQPAGSGSNRSSVDSHGVTSPGAVGSRQGSINGGSGTIGTADGALDYGYLKTILLQFLEQKDKRHQMQLVPVLGMLLHFDRNDEQKWATAIGAR